MRKKIKARVTRSKVIPNVTQVHKNYLEIPENHNSLGMIACDVENVMYLALDDASKNANVKVVYSSAAFTGRGNIWAHIRGQVVGMISAENVTDVHKGLRYIRHFIENEAELYSFSEEDDLICYAHLNPRPGSYYREEYGIPEGMAVVHLAASPVESIYALDQALKTGQTKVAKLFELPTKTNTGGAILYGTYSACRSSRDAFIDAVEYCSMYPLEFGKQ